MSQAASQVSERRVVVTGVGLLCGVGNTAPEVWRQILADVFGTPVVTMASQEGSALGAAILAMVATGEYSSVEEACRAMVRERDIIEPRREESKVYAAGHAVYRSLYPALNPLFPRMG